MALRTVMTSKLPMIIIVGATGTGKTKLGVELAQKFGSEIISADSMQIYKGLDIVTAKASPAERQAARHHLLDILEPHQVFTVVDFRSRALKIINELREQRKIPIVVGGTNYYIESIVYKILVEDSDNTEQLMWDRCKRKRDSDDEPTQHKEAKTETNPTLQTSAKNTEQGDTEDVEAKKLQLQKDVDEEKNFTDEEIHAKLKEIDPEMASRLHPNNRRKVLRSIEVWLKGGRRHSSILDEQSATEGRLRLPGETVVLWLTCQQSVLDERLNTRVERMLEQGLIAELLHFHHRHNKQRIIHDEPPDYTKGVFQTLGFKEFHQYLMLPEGQRSSDEGQLLLRECVENMKMGTRRYARRQIKMVRSRFLEHPKREVAPIFELDTTNLSEWDENVKNKAIHIVESYMNDTPCKYQFLTANISEERRNSNALSSNYCDVCNRLIIGDGQYAIHLNSHRHMKVLKKKKLAEKKSAVIDEITENKVAEIDGVTEKN